MSWYLPDRHPLLWEELRRRLRGARGYWALLAYSLVLVIILGAFSMLASMSVLVTNISRGPSAWPLFGHELWLGFLAGQLALVLLLSPVITAGAISSEREKGALEMIFLSGIDTLTLTVDKFFGAIGQLLMVIFSGLPIISVVFIFGGVSPEEMAIGYLILLLSGLFYATLGYLASCLFVRTLAATIWAYGFLLIILVGLPLIPLLLLFLDPAFSPGSFEALLYLNPALCYTIYAGGQLNELCWPLITLFLGSVLILAMCLFLLFRLRGSRMLLPHRLSLAAARYSSRGI